MDIKEVAKKKWELEKQMTESLSSLVNTFKKETGVSPSDIYISLITSTIMGEMEETSVVAAVTIDIKL